MADYEDDISDSEKTRICSSFITHAPPGEFNEVFNDVRVLLNNDSLLKSEASTASFVQYSMDQLLPVAVDGVDDLVIISVHGKLPQGRFYDPRNKKSFRYDHLRGQVFDVEDCSTEDNDSENYRAAIDEAFRDYIENHYPDGAYAVYGSMDGDGSVKITVCIEDHRYEPQNFWNGRWRSEWNITICDSTSKTKVVGVLRNQVHYYEDGNVQLVSRKECKDENIPVKDTRQVAKEFVKLVMNAEADYQKAISENYNTMSEVTFKALRRQLPVTREKIQWNKILGYKIGKDIQK